MKKTKTIKKFVIHLILLYYSILKPTCFSEAIPRVCDDFAQVPIVLVAQVTRYVIAVIPLRKAVTVLTSILPGDVSHIVLTSH